MGADPKSKLAAVTAAIDAAVAQPEPERIEAVKKVLSQVCSQKADIFEPHFLATTPDRYARRLLHRDPAGRYTLVVAVWAPGQSTPLHDHGGLWCVEGVFQGRLRVTSFDILEERGDIVQLKAEDSVIVSEGEVGTLIPPNEYHITENAQRDGVTVTLHVYGGELTSCCGYHPQTGGYRRERLELPYTE